jgi:hypothetical protein
MSDIGVCLKCNNSETHCDICFRCNDFGSCPICADGDSEDENASNAQSALALEASSSQSLPLFAIIYASEGGFSRYVGGHRHTDSCPGLTNCGHILTLARDYYGWQVLPWSTYTKSYGTEILEEFVEQDGGWDGDCPGEFSDEVCTVGRKLSNTLDKGFTLKRFSISSLQINKFRPRRRRTCNTTSRSICISWRG